MIRSLFITLILATVNTLVLAQQFTTVADNIPASLRGLATFKNNIVWVSGNNGTVGYSNDAGRTWKWVNPKGYEDFDFRDIAVFSKKEAVIMSSGSPAVILRTTDAGKNWQEVYRNDQEDIFLNAMDFHGKRGYILGDPIDGNFQMLKTQDKGKTWTDESNNFMLFADDGEVAFAASGSNIKVFDDFVFIGTGGQFAGFFYYSPKNLRIDKYECPIWYGEDSAGIFAIDFIDKKTGIAVGGNYLKDKDNRNNILITNDAGLNWIKPNTPVNGYRSDVMYLNKDIVIATGTSGTDISYDGGMNWKNIGQDSFNSIAKSADNKIIYLTGSKGNIVQLTL